MDDLPTVVSIYLLVHYSRLFSSLIAHSRAVMLHLRTRNKIIGEAIVSPFLVIIKAAIGSLMYILVSAHIILEV